MRPTCKTIPRLIPGESTQYVVALIIELARKEGSIERQHFGDVIGAERSATGAVNLYWNGTRRAKQWIVDALARKLAEVAATAERNIPRARFVDQSRYSSMPVRCTLTVNAHDCHGDGADACEALANALARTMHIDTACELAMDARRAGLPTVDQLKAIGEQFPHKAHTAEQCAELAAVPATVRQELADAAQPAPQGLKVTVSTIGEYVRVQREDFDYDTRRQEGERPAQTLQRAAQDKRAQAARLIKMAERLELGVWVAMNQEQAEADAAKKAKKAAYVREQRAQAARHINGHAPAIATEEERRADAIRQQELAAHYYERQRLETGRMDQWSTCEETKWQALCAQKNAAAFAQSARNIMGIRPE